VWILIPACFAWVAILPKQPLLQVLQPLGVDSQRTSIGRERKQVHITHGLTIIIILQQQQQQQPTKRGELCGGRILVWFPAATSA
jgi:hypothetical protein